MAAAALIIVGCGSEPAGDKYRPESGSVTLDLTTSEDAGWFLTHARPFYRLDNARAADYVHIEWRNEKGICFTPSSRLQQFSPATVSAFLMNPDNHWGTGRPIPPRVQSPTVPNECDSAVGVTIPYFTPKSIQVQLSSMNITDANRGTLFSDANRNRDAPASTATSLGWVGYLMRIPAVAEAGGDVVAQVSADTRYEFAYIRSSNGLAVPGPYSADPYTTVQYGATFYEWFVLRARVPVRPCALLTHRGKLTGNSEAAPIAALAARTAGPSRQRCWCGKDQRRRRWNA